MNKLESYNPQKFQAIVNTFVWLYKKQTFTSSVFIPAKVFTNSLNFSLFNFWAVEEKYKYHKKSFFER